MRTSELDLDALETVARAADEDDPGSWFKYREPWYNLPWAKLFNEPEARHIASFSPTVCLALLAAARKNTEANDE